MNIHSTTFEFSDFTPKDQAYIASFPDPFAPTKSSWGIPPFRNISIGILVTASTLYLISLYLHRSRSANPRRASQDRPIIRMEEDRRGSAWETQPLLGAQSQFNRGNWIEAQNSPRVVRVSVDAGTYGEYVARRNTLVQNQVQIQRQKGYDSAMWFKPATLALWGDESNDEGMHALRDDGVQDNEGYAEELSGYDTDNEASWTVDEEELEGLRARASKPVAVRRDVSKADENNMSYAVVATPPSQRYKLATQALADDASEFEMGREGSWADVETASSMLSEQHVNNLVRGRIQELPQIRMVSPTPTISIKTPHRRLHPNLQKTPPRVYKPAMQALADDVSEFEIGGERAWADVETSSRHGSLDFLEQKAPDLEREKMEDGNRDEMLYETMDEVQHSVHWARGRPPYAPTQQASLANNNIISMTEFASSSSNSGISLEESCATRQQMPKLVPTQDELRG